MQAAIRKSHESRGETNTANLGMSLEDAVASRVLWSEWQLQNWCGPSISFDIGSLQKAAHANHVGKSKKPGPPHIKHPAGTPMKSAFK
jgi:hypothetical protein